MTGVQTCALPISPARHGKRRARDRGCRDRTRRVRVRERRGDADADARWFKASRTSGGVNSPFGDLHGSGRGGTRNVDPRTQLGRLSGWDPWTHQRSSSNGIVESVGGEREARSIYAIHHPFHTSFAGLSFRPQIYRQGYPNIERNPQMPESMLRADERERPHVLSMHAWGAQSEATGDWSHVEAPRDSRPRGGTGNGGVMFHPPRFEMADYFGINSAVDVEDTTSSKATQHYVLAGPNVAFALGKPKVNGGLQPGAVTIGRGTTTTRPLVVNYDSAELLSGYRTAARSCWSWRREAARRFAFPTAPMRNDPQRHRVAWRASIRAAQPT